MSGAFLFGVIIVSGVVYHLAQKGGGAGSPWSTLAVAYGVAFLVTLVLAFAQRAPTPTREGTIAGVLIGLAALGIEAGYFLIYRAGWPVASTSVIASVACTAILAVIGATVLGEPLGIARIGGITLAAGAGILMTRGA